MKSVVRKTEDAVFREKLSDTELAGTAGGLCGSYQGSCLDATYDDGQCTSFYSRNIYDGGFPNCAATVEDGSWCKNNDACYDLAVSYEGMHDCAKAWE